MRLVYYKFDCTLHGSLDNTISADFKSHATEMKSPSQLPETCWDHRKALGWDKLCPPRPVYPAQRWICSMQQECWWWRGFWGNVFIETRRLGAGRAACLVFYTLRMRDGSPCHFWRFMTTVTPKLTIWRSGGDLVVPCWLGSQVAQVDWRSGRFESGVHSLALEIEKQKNTQRKLLIKLNFK